ncbi:hypothetical protein CAPTEDRAFT_171853 [Capitella teleta]|uniref:MHD domain-containing protein n=1 Tax=Capitella teleta TaxID=283909 RepID=R7U3M3_CAPTE|nr:hypothetical protein CAPTEDRAFT_171853 [Capitella teleta]|eukprot:ELU00579.1 hypothetical protein CAPTEDRAFT_171853 [Capitella teleta]
MEIGAEVSAAEAVAGGFNPFATITDADHPHAAGDEFDPFQTIHDDDAFEVSHQSSKDDEEPTSPARVNPFDKEPPLDEKFAKFETKDSKDETKSPMSGASTDDSPYEEELEPLDPFHPPFDGPGWKMLLRQPIKKKLTQNRFWKPVFVRLVMQKDVPTIRVFNNDQEAQPIHELPLQPAYNLCNLGLQQFDQFGKCHTVKIQYVFYRERVGVKADRITPTLSDLTRVRDFKSLKDLVHRPKTTMILDHAPQASELLKFGGLEYDEFKCFIRSIEDALFLLKSGRDSKSMSYTKDEITVDVVDEYYADIDRDGHIIFHKGRIRMFCLAFITGGMPRIEVGLNDKRRQGKEIVGRKDIVPIKTDEWIKIEGAELHCTIDQEEYEKTKLVKFTPLDAVQYELMRFRTRPRLNKELPLQIRCQMSVIERHVEIRCDVMIPGYHSNSRRSNQTPCEDIQIRFPIPEPWWYFFRVEKRFKYGSVKSSHRKAGKIKGIERLTMMAQGMMPPSLIEVSKGAAKFENVHQAVVWRIPKLPERNEEAYKTHVFVLKLDLEPHDAVPETYDKYIHAEYHMPNSTVSRAQIRSIGVNSEEPPDRWVHHLARYEYRVEIEFCDKPKAPLQQEIDDPAAIPTKASPEDDDDLIEDKKPEKDDDDDSSDSSSDSD